MYLFYKSLYSSVKLKLALIEDQISYNNLKIGHNKSRVMIDNGGTHHQK